MGSDDREALAALCRSASRTLWVCAEDGASRETCESASRLLDRAAQALRAKPSEQPDWSCPNCGWRRGAPPEEPAAGHASRALIEAISAWAE